MNMAIAQATLSTSTSVSGDAGGGSLIGGLVGLVIAVLMVVAMWRVFAKAGRPGWASLIPIYNTITMLRITGRSGWWFLGFMVPFLNIFVAIRLVFDLARVFGRGVGFGFGLLFLLPIFILILAFGDAQYVGPTGKRETPLSPPDFAAAPIVP
jgi:hypothetical protein